MNNLGTINNQSSSTQFANMQKDINWLYGSSIYRNISSEFKRS